MSLPQSDHPVGMGYRADIDGLRAIAVLAVVIFHAFPFALPGGFVGVDLFFVISGYLITGLIVRETDEGRFRLSHFYARRIRRIFPALALILSFCWVAGWVVLTASEYKQLARHVAGGAGFVSNWVYWQEAGYFDNAAETKPLLHLWSLGIEEQFYLVWPPVLLWWWRKSRSFAWPLFSLLVASLSWSLVEANRNLVADFYSPLTRFWELLLGGGLAYVLIRQPAIGLGVRRFLPWLGLLLIGIAITIISKEDRFPGGWAVLPTVGAVLVILGGGVADTWLNRRLLSSAPLVWVGLISYPLYLWHWPLLSFARIMGGETPSATTRMELICASVVLAWLTYRLLERPIRFGLHSRNAIVPLCGVMVLLLVAGVTVKKLDGAKFRHQSLLNGDINTLKLGADRGRLANQCGVAAEKTTLFQFCLQDDRQEPRYAVLGDSKAEALFYGLVRESQPDQRWLLMGSVNPRSAQADEKNRLAYETVTNNRRIQGVVLVNALRSTMPVDGETGFVQADISPAVTDRLVADYTMVIRSLEKGGKRVVLVIDHPTFPDPRSCISGGLTGNALLDRWLRRTENPRCTLHYTDHLAGTQPYRAFVQRVKGENPGLIVYDPTPLLCDPATNLCPMIRDRHFLYSYGDHLSDDANSLIARDLLPILSAF